MVFRNRRALAEYAAAYRAAHMERERAPDRRSVRLFSFTFPPTLHYFYIWSLRSGSVADLAASRPLNNLALSNRTEGAMLPPEEARAGARAGVNGTQQATKRIPRAYASGVNSCHNGLTSQATHGRALRHGGWRALIQRHQSVGDIGGYPLGHQLRLAAQPGHPVDILLQPSSSGEPSKD